MRVQTEIIAYDDGGVACEGYLAWDADQTSPAPGVAIVHEWMGIGDNVRRRARMLAELGYVALAIDAYGAHIRPQNAGEARTAMLGALTDRTVLRQRLVAGVTRLQTDPRVDPTRTAAMGYCFGGACALELAAVVPSLCGVVSFHGGLSNVSAYAERPNARILVLHGAEDPLVGDAGVAGFIAKLRAVAADWQFIHYGGAVHSFTNPAANDRLAGMAFDEPADRRSWAHMQLFFREVFGH